MAIAFGANVRVASTPLTASFGLAGLSSKVHGKTILSITGVEVVGGAAADNAINAPLDRQVREKRLDFRCPHFQRMPFVVKQNKPPTPVDIRLLGPPRVMQQASLGGKPIKQPRRLIRR